MKTDGEQIVLATVLDLKELLGNQLGAVRAAGGHVLLSGKRLRGIP